MIKCTPALSPPPNELERFLVTTRAYFKTTLKLLVEPLGGYGER